MIPRFKTPQQILVEIDELQRMSQDGMIIYWAARGHGACHEDALDAVVSMLGQDDLDQQGSSI